MIIEIPCWYPVTIVRSSEGLLPPTTAFAFLVAGSMSTLLGTN